MLGELPAEGACEGTELPAGGGLIPRIYHHLFARMRELQGGQARPGRSVSFSLSCALLEIYKEQVGGGGVGGAATCTKRQPRARHCSAQEACGHAPPTSSPPATRLQVTDLLAPSSAGAVALREDKREGVFAEGLSWHAVDSSE